MVEFKSVEEAIRFISDYWAGFEEAPEIMREVDTELDKDKRWLFIMGRCNICGYECQTFIPACAFEDGVTGMECDDCGLMSVYPRGLEIRYELN